MIVLGVDLSTCTGVAAVGLHKAMPSVLHAEEVQAPKQVGQGMARVNFIVARILELREKVKAQGLIIEDYAVGKFAGSAIVSIEIGAVLRFILWQEGVPYIEVAPSALKKFVTGKGNAKKDQMTLEVYKRFGYSASSNDIADAVALGMFGACYLRPGLFTSAMRSVVESCRENQPALMKLIENQPLKS
jgi:crossover junction endodeoxyribonuclease RuvC